MKEALKTAIGWEAKDASERIAFLRRLEWPRYRFFYWLSFAICLLPIPLHLVLRFCLSDKHQPTEHQYGRTYGRLFWRLKYRPITLLEIGIGGYSERLGGESLNAWQCYFPFARIIGCDIRDKRQLQTPRTRIYQVDQSSIADLNGLISTERNFDIVIDDGSHLNAHQILTFKTLFPALASGGIYIIEDVQSSYWTFGEWDGAVIDTSAFNKTCMGHFLRLASYLNYREFDSRTADRDMLEQAKQIRQIIFEHNLVIIFKIEPIAKLC